MPLACALRPGAWLATSTRARGSSCSSGLGPSGSSDSQMRQARTSRINCKNGARGDGFVMRRIHARQVAMAVAASVGLQTQCADELRRHALTQLLFAPVKRIEHGLVLPQRCITVTRVIGVDPVKQMVEVPVLLLR